MTMSCVAEAVVTSNAAPATVHGEDAGSLTASKIIAPTSRIWVSMSQPRRRPSRRESRGTSSASTAGAHSGFAQ